MTGGTNALVFWRTEHSLLTLDELAVAAGLPTELVRRFVGSGLIEPLVGAGPPPLFTASTEERLRCIMRLRRDLGVNVAGIAVILEMRERILNLQRELQYLRRRLGLKADTPPTSS